MRIAYEIEMEVDEDSLEAHHPPSDFFFSGGKAIDLQREDVFLESAEVILEESLTHFWNEHGPDLKIEQESSLALGLEISHLIWCDGIKEANEFLESFFESFDDQSQLFFDETCGFHVNISHPHGQYNLVKGIVMLNENRIHELFPTRKNNRHCTSIRKTLVGRARHGIQDLSNTQKEELKLKLISDTKAAEAFFSGHLEFVSKMRRFGMNFQSIFTAPPKEQRIEFRYPGGCTNLDDMMEVTSLFIEIIEEMVFDEPSEEYDKALRNLIEEVF